MEYFITGSLLFGIIGFLGVYIFIIQIDRLDKQMLKKSIKLQGVFKFIVFRAMRKMIINENSIIEDRKNVEWEKCAEFKNSVTLIALLMQIGQYLHLSAIIILFIAGRPYFDSISMIISAVLSCLYLPVIIMYGIIVSSKEKKFKDKFLTKEKDTDTLCNNIDLDSTL